MVRGDSAVVEDWTALDPVFTPDDVLVITRETNPLVDPPPCRVAQRISRALQPTPLAVLQPDSEAECDLDFPVQVQMFNAPAARTVVAGAVGSSVRWRMDWARSEWPRGAVSQLQRP